MLTAVWQHACRIPPTLNYARSQQNNHLLSEAVGLMLAGSLFSESKEGKKWFACGKNEFQKGICHQVQANGTYSQHSANYHRMMLHLALLYKKMMKQADLPVPQIVQEKLAAASRWLIGQMDLSSGRLPNLGHNDGSNLLPFGCNEYLDYRPTAQAASRSFLGSPVLPSGPWDELSAWLNLINPEEKTLEITQISSEAIHRVGNQNAWGSLRSTRFCGRPAHADLLHVDLWWDGINFACDPGTYSYNAPAPWNNSLSRTAVHNTVTVDHQDQMTQAGKFLWLKQAKTQPISVTHENQSSLLFCDVPHCYTQFRTLKFIQQTGFEVTDEIEFNWRVAHSVHISIHWLLPDWNWMFDENNLLLNFENRKISISIRAGILSLKQKEISGHYSLIRAGETLFGENLNPLLGWFSPTYNKKQPSLSLTAEFEVNHPIRITSEFKLSKS